MDVPLQNEMLKINWSSKVKAHLVSAELLQRDDVFKCNSLFSVFAAKICLPA